MTSASSPCRGPARWGSCCSGCSRTRGSDARGSCYIHVPPAPNNFPAISEAGTTSIVLAGIAACVGAPVVEEIFFRGLLYRSLRNRLSVAPACLLAGAIFGVLHWQYPLVVRPELAFFGVVACLLYERTGSLLPGIALHSVIDASGFEYALTGRVIVVVSVFLLLAVALLLRARRPRAGAAVPFAEAETALTGPAGEPDLVPGVARSGARDDAAVAGPGCREQGPPAPAVRRVWGSP